MREGAAAIIAYVLLYKPKISLTCLSERPKALAMVSMPTPIRYKS